MGYRSYFTITAEWPEEYEDFATSTGIPVKEIIKKYIDKIIRYSFDDLEAQTPRTAQYYSSDEMKWYDWQEDMQKMCEQLPAITFTVYMDGESSDDHRQLIAKNGMLAVSHGDLVYWNTPESAKARDAIIANPPLISPKEFILPR